MLSSYYVNKIVHGSKHLLVPTTYLFVLSYAEVQELRSQLRLHHANVLISTILQVIKLKPKTHYFVVEVGTWLDEFDV